MSIISKLDVLFESKTILPVYSLPQVICVLLEIYTSNDGIGRYQLKSKVGLGEGSLRTLLKRLEQNGFINVKGKRAGHTLSEMGLNFVKELMNRFTFPMQFQNPPSWLKALGSIIHYSIIRSEYIRSPLTNGIKQRDTAMIHGGKGGVCLIFDGKTFLFPGDKYPGSDLSEINTDGLKINDIICFAGADEIEKSKIALLAAIITFL